jgi:hypothetical protein
MKFFLLLLMLGQLSQASPPIKPEVSRYAELWLNSPFTTKPIVDNGAYVAPVNEIDDWSLGGVSKFPDGYFVILLNKKKPGERKVIEPGSNSAFKVLAVTDNADDYRKTTVKVSYNGMEGIVTYAADTKATVTAANPNAQMNGQHDSQITNMPGSLPPNMTGMSGLRQRRIPNPSQQNGQVNSALLPNSLQQRVGGVLRGLNPPILPQSQPADQARSLEQQPSQPVTPPPAAAEQ